MGRNVEIKARVADAVALLAAALALPARDCGAMRQVDTYFIVPRGRLKLREIDGERAELYSRCRVPQNHSRVVGP